MTAPTFDLLAVSDLDDEFDLDIRIAVGADVALPEAGFSCSWYTCQTVDCTACVPHTAICTTTGFQDRGC